MGRNRHHPERASTTGNAGVHGLAAAIASLLLSAPHPLLAPVVLGLPLLATLTTEVQAQTRSEATLLSNTSYQPASIIGTDYEMAQEFLTGAATGGYTITSVDIRLRNINTTGRTTVVTIREAAAFPRGPGKLVATLSNPSSFTLNPYLNTFTAPKNTVLKPNTTYFLVVNDGRESARSANIHFSLTNQTAKITSAARGWSLTSPHYRDGTWQTTGLGIIFAIKTTVAVPAKPTGLTATAGLDQVTLTWADPSNKDITNYEYRQKEGSGAWGNWQDILTSNTDTTSHTVTGLKAVTSYSFQIRAVAITVNSAAAEVTVVTAFAAPTRLNTTASNQQIELNWDNPNNNAITKYQYQTSVSPFVGGRYLVTSFGNVWSDMTPSNKDTTFYIATGLDNDKLYNIRIRAVAGTANSLPSAVVEARPEDIADPRIIGYNDFRDDPVAVVVHKETSASAWYISLLSPGSKGTTPRRIHQRLNSLATVTY